MPFDVAALRAEFPSLASGIAHFDGPGGTQTPRVVGDAIAAVLTGPLSNRGADGPASETNAEDAVAGFRQAAADLLAADPRGIVYGRSATQLAYDFSRHLAKGWGPGDEIVVTRLDHDANVRPWVQAAEHAGATVRWIALDPQTAELDPASVAEAITPATRLVAVTAASNLLGTKPPVRAIADAAHAVGALTYVDGVHATAHGLIDVGELGRRLLRLLALQVPRAALRAARGGTGAARDHPARQAAPRPRTRCPSDSSSAPCRTRRWRV